MAQHLWRGVPRFRMCEVCDVFQTERDGDWLPPVPSICPGDPDDGGRLARRRPPIAPAGAPKLLEELVA
jgi:hypothetical protein